MKRRSTRARGRRPRSPASPSGSRPGRASPTARCRPGSSAPRTTRTGVWPRWKAKANGYDGALLLNTRGKLAEAPGACCFMTAAACRSRRPSLDILESVTRTTLLELFRTELGQRRSSARSTGRALPGGRGLPLRERVGDHAGRVRRPTGARRRRPSGPTTRAIQACYFAVVRGEKRPIATGSARLRPPNQLLRPGVSARGGRPMRIPRGRRDLRSACVRAGGRALRSGMSHADAPRSPAGPRRWIPPHEILDGLNLAQVEAVTHDQGPLLIVAGAGTGKTTVLASHRIPHRHAPSASGGDPRPHVHRQGGARDGGARRRAGPLRVRGGADRNVPTFGDWLLREHALELGLTPAFRVLSRAEQVLFLGPTCSTCPSSSTGRSAIRPVTSRRSPGSSGAPRTRTSTRRTIWPTRRFSRQSRPPTRRTRSAGTSRREPASWRAPMRHAGT